MNLLYDRPRLLERLHQCQNGEASCMRLLKEIEAAADQLIEETKAEIQGETPSSNPHSTEVVHGASSAL